METLDKVALGILCLILLATAVSRDYLFALTLVLLAVIYLAARARAADMRRRELIAYKERMKKSDEEYWGSVGDKELPEEPPGE